MWLYGSYLYHISVLFRIQRFPTKRTTNFFLREYVPFEVIERIVENAHKLDHPSKYQVHSKPLIKEIAFDPYMTMV